MHTEIEKTKPRPTGRKYNSVEHFMCGEAVSQEVQAKVAEHKAESSVVLYLAKLRQETGMTQEELAKQLNVTQSAISKLESGRDEEISLREIREYAKATNRRIIMSFGKPLTHVDSIKFHAGGLHHHLQKLAEIANQHDELQSEIKGFFGEAWYNLFKILASCTGKLPSGNDDVEIRIEVVKTFNSNLLTPPRHNCPKVVA